MGRPAVEDVYLAELVARLGDVHAVYLSGSAALGGYERRRSDLDVIVVVEAPLAGAQRDAIVARCSHAALPCPARKLELVVYGADGAVELNLNSGPDGTTAEPADWFWFVVDRAIAREHAVALLGPPASVLIPAPDRARVLEALEEMVAWYARHEPGEASEIAAARARAYAAEGRCLP